MHSFPAVSVFPESLSHGIIVPCPHNDMCYSLASVLKRWFSSLVCQLSDSQLLVFSSLSDMEIVSLPQGALGRISPVLTAPNPAVGSEPESRDSWQPPELPHEGEERTVVQSAWSQQPLSHSCHCIHLVYNSWYI